MRRLTRLAIAVLMGCVLLAGCAGGTEADYTVTKGENGVDFVLEFPQDKEITVLQIADTQMQRYGVGRNDTRIAQTTAAFFTDMPQDHQTRVWQYMDEAVEASQPDLIVLTGDNIYGEMDDDGQMWMALCEKMDSYRTPWLTVFGNHDNESAKGVTWQIEQLQKSEYCVFAQGEVTGNSNYSVLIQQGDTPKYLFYLLDTNGCRVIESNPGEAMMPDNVDIDKICQTQGLQADQLAWVRTGSAKAFAAYGRVPVLMFFHIPPEEARTAVDTLYPDAYSKVSFRPDREGDLGIGREKHSGFACEGFWELAGEIGCEGIFVGHQHKIATSIVYDGIRITYGLKTGTYDSHSSDLLGATEISLGDDGVRVNYLYSQIAYNK